MGKKRHEKDKQKRSRNEVENGDAVKKQRDPLDVSTENMNNASTSINIDDNKKKRKEGSNEKKDRMKKRKLEFDTDDREPHKAQKKHKESPGGVGDVKEASIETCKAGKQNTTKGSSKGMALENSFEYEAKIVTKEKHKSKNRDGIGAVSTATENLENSKMQDRVEVQKSCSTEDINKVVDREDVYEKRKKKKKKPEKVPGNVSGHIAITGSGTVGYEFDKKNNQVDGSFIKVADDSGNGTKGNRNSNNDSVGADKPRNLSSGIKNNSHSNDELNGNAAKCIKLGVAVDNDDGGSRDKKKKSQKTGKTGSDGKGQTFPNGFEDHEGFNRKDIEDSPEHEVECRKSGGAADDTEDGKVGRKKKQSKSVERESEGNRHKEDARTRISVNTTDESKNASPKERSKKVSFSDHVEVFPCADGSDAKKDGEEGLIYGRRYSKEEDELVMNAVANYIESHQLGDEGLNMVLNCRSYSEVKNCWKEIQEAIPWRPVSSVYHRAHVLFERDEKRRSTPEEREFIQNFVEKHGRDWKLLGETLGKHRLQVKDIWRRIKLANRNRGKWQQDEYQSLFDLVNLDLSMKVFEDRKSKHGMLRDDIPWSAISDKMETRCWSDCCLKWYRSLSSPMVAEGVWSDADDYRMLDALSSLDACCMEDVDWDNLIEHRSGELCRKRWNQMVQHIGPHRNESFAEQVEILCKRYRPDMLDAREAFDSKVPVDLP